MPYEYKAIIRTFEKVSHIQYTNNERTALPEIADPLDYAEQIQRTEKWLNEMSLEGWDLVNVVTRSFNVTGYIFRRRLDL